MVRKIRGGANYASKYGMYACMYVWMNVRMYVCMHYVCMYACMYVCMCTHDSRVQNWRSSIRTCNTDIL